MQQVPGALPVIRMDDFQSGKRRRRTRNHVGPDRRELPEGAFYIRSAAMGFAGALRRHERTPDQDEGSRNLTNCRGNASPAS